MLIEAFFINLNLTTALITFVRIAVNKFRNLFWPSATVATMTTRGAPLRMADFRFWLYSGLENLTQHLLQLITQCLPFLFNLFVFLAQLFNLYLSQRHHLFHLVKPLP